MAANTLGEGSTYDPASRPPPFGHAMRKYWAFEKDYINLNHGSYGSQPLPVFAESYRVQLQSEQNPDKFHRTFYAPAAIEARSHIAKFIGADLGEVVFVPNATHGVNTVLRNIEWKDGDIILTNNITYGSVANTVRYLADRSESPRPSVHTLTYTLPMSHQEIVDAFRARIRELKQLHSDITFNSIPRSAGGGNRFVAVIDAIVSLPGALFPWKELVKICAEEDVWSIVDAAHSVGQELDINLSESKPDFWISNCHKWLYAKRSCAILYVPQRNQHIIKSSIPTTHAYSIVASASGKENSVSPFVAQHEWTATLDYSPYLSVTPALKFREWLGGEAKINAYCHDIAIRGGKRLSEILGTKVMDEYGELTLNMTNVLLPLPTETPEKPSAYTPESLGSISSFIQERLLVKWNVFALHFFYAGAWWVRASAQVWNEISDFEYLGKALKEVCEEVNEKFVWQAEV